MKNKNKITSDDILAYLKRDGFNSNCEIGVTEFCPYGLGKRMDLFYFNRWDRQTRGYEIKVTRADFLADKKWQEYLPFCHWFYFIAPEGIIKPKELPDNIGLIEVMVKDRIEERKAWDGNDYVVEEKIIHYTLGRKFTKKAKRIRTHIGDKEYLQLLEGLMVKVLYEKNLLK